MRINVTLTTASIQEAVNRLKNVETQLSSVIVPKYLEKCCMWLKTRANEYLYTSGLNSGVIGEVERGWTIIQISNNSYMLRNTGRAYLLEFGVGVVGEENQHPDAASADYEYNKESRYKKTDGSWIFKVDDRNTLDIKKENVMPRNDGTIQYNTGKTIRTKGQRGTMFLHNAVIDFKTTGAYKKLWAETKAEYIR